MAHSCASSDIIITSEIYAETDALADKFWQDFPILSYILLVAPLDIVWVAYVKA